MNGRHMRMRCGLLGLAIALGGCVLSVESMLTESDVTFDTRLLGAWEEVDGSDRAVVARSGQNGYAIEYTSDGTGRYEARLGRLGGRLILDVLEPPEERAPKPDGEPLILRHFTLVLDVGEDEIRVAFINRDSLAAALQAGRVRLAHTDSSSGYISFLVLQSTTEELRAALGSYLASPGALDWIVFRRVHGGRNTAPARSGHADSSGI